MSGVKLIMKDETVLVQTGDGSYKTVSYDDLVKAAGIRSSSRRSKNPAQSSPGSSLWQNTLSAQALGQQAQAWMFKKCYIA